MVVDSLEVFYLATALTVQKKKGGCFKNELSNRRPFFELAGNTDSGKLLYNLSRMVKKTKLLWRIEKTSMKLARTVTIKNKVFKVLVAAPHSVKETAQLSLLEDSFGNVILVNKFQTKLFFRIRRF